MNREPEAIEKHRQLKGPLQAAIDSDPSIPAGDSTDKLFQVSQINRPYFEEEALIDLSVLDTAFLGREAGAGSLAEGSPGYLTQADLFSPLGPVLTNRADTFLVRAYGEVIHPVTKKVVSRAWCEGVVQRFPEYLDTRNPPETASDDKALLSLNAKFGRRCRLVHFRWLDEDEI